MRLIGAGLLALTLLSTACGQGQKVGSEKLLEGIDEQGPGQRLGARTPAPKQTPTSLTVGGTPTPRATPTPAATPKYFDVELVAASPFYKPGNSIQIRVGVTLRVTNKDATAERSKGRSFTAKNGAFHSGLLKVGQAWTRSFGQPGGYEIVDEGLTFATATFEVVP